MAECFGKLVFSVAEGSGLADEGSGLADEGIGAVDEAISVRASCLGAAAGGRVSYTRAFDLEPFGKALRSGGIGRSARTPR